MSGVIKDTLDSDGGSISGDEDFFSVARTIPFVARENISVMHRKILGCHRRTFNA